MKNIENADAVSNAVTSNVENFLKRAFMFLSEGKYSEADSYAEKVLDVDTENADAYLCKLLSELRLREVAELSKCNVDFSKSPNYLKARNFGDEKRQRILDAYLKRATAYALVESGRRALETLEDCQRTAKTTEADLNRKLKKGKVRGAVYLTAFAIEIVGILLLVLSWTSVMDFTAAGPVLLVAGVSLLYLMFMLVSKIYCEEIRGEEADSFVMLRYLILFLVTLFGGLGVWGVVMSVKLLKKKKTDNSASDGLRKNAEECKMQLEKLRENAERENAALREFLERENI